jgi:hypothetical protein
MSTEDMPEKPSEESAEWHWARAKSCDLPIKDNERNHHWPLGSPVAANFRSCLSPDADPAWEQRVDNCKVPLDRRGPKPRPDECGDSASTRNHK